MSSYEMDSFQEIPEDDISKLIKMLEEDLPFSIHALEYLRTALNWRGKKPEYQVLVLAPYGDFGGSTFLLHTSVSGSFCGTAYSTTEDGAERLERALVSTRRVAWGDRFAFSCLQPRPGRAVLAAASRLAPPPLTVHLNQPYYMTPAQAASLIPKLDDDVYIDDLKKEHGQKINEAWPHHSPELEKLVYDMVNLNGGVGVFRKTDKCLLAWGLITFYGGIGLVHTLKGHERKGYGTGVVRALATRLALTGRNIHLNVVEGNDGGEIFFTKLGFTHLPKYSWVYRNFF